MELLQSFEGLSGGLFRSAILCLSAGLTTRLALAAEACIVRGGKCRIEERALREAPLRAKPADRAKSVRGSPLPFVE